ncbi:MAG: hypothetical protein KAT17_04570 [Candidatus Aminicenantes bacterium]|nr:hypothetical protein [Candidatus Aminicenantes bacterium]
MKKIILLSIGLLVILNGCFIFDYNGGAEVIVRNIGELPMFAQIETGYSIIDAGEEDTFTLTWPGHDDMNVNLITYPYQHPEMGENLNFDIEDGETKIIEKGYYIEDLTKK